MSTILVTGGAGFIGSAYVRYTLSVGRDQIIILDALTYAGNLRNIANHIHTNNLFVSSPQSRWGMMRESQDGKQKMKRSDSILIRHRIQQKAAPFAPVILPVAQIETVVGNILKNNESCLTIIGNILDFELVQGLVPWADYIVHFAAETHVDRSIDNPGQFLRTDILGTFELLEAARRSSRLQKFIHISTDEIYGTTHGQPFIESDPINPRNPYSASKASADRLVSAYFTTYNLPICILRPTNNYGPFQYPEKLIPLMVIQAIQQQPLPVYGNGAQRRDWLYVNDTVQAIEMIRHLGKIGEAYNVAGGNERENIDIVRQILKYLHRSESLIHFVDDRPGHDMRYALDDSKIRQMGYQGSTLETHLEETIQWYCDHREWWERIIHEDEEYQEFFQKWYEPRMRTTPG